MPTSAFLPVTVDKSHLITIGERLYTESIELIRELVNNAYDADATEVRVTVRDDLIRVEDNGAGMDFDGLGQYFNIGSPEKLQKPKVKRLTQEITLMKDAPRDPRKAFDRQSKLLRDAFTDSQG